MLELKSFRNSDPPHIAAIWRSQPPQRGILQPISAPMLEYGVFSKMHFDRDGLIVAWEDGSPVGFVHAGFGPNEQGDEVDRSVGSTYMLMVRGGHGQAELADRLLQASEQYLRARGAKVLYAGGIKPINSFYLGLYGGSEIPGVLTSDNVLQQVCRRHGYQEVDHVNVLQLDLTRFRPPVNRELRAIRRTTKIAEALDPPVNNWWEACVWGAQQRICFRLLDKYRQTEIASATLWDVQPLSAGWGVSTAGLFELYVDPEHRRRGSATYLISEIVRALRQRGIGTIEVQTMAANEPAQALYKKLGFTFVDEGVVFRKGPSHEAAHS